MLFWRSELTFMTKEYPQIIILIDFEFSLSVTPGFFIDKVGK